MSQVASLLLRGVHWSPLFGLTDGFATWHAVQIVRGHTVALKIENSHQNIQQ